MSHSKTKNVDKTLARGIKIVLYKEKIINIVQFLLSSSLLFFSLFASSCVFLMYSINYTDKNLDHLNFHLVVNIKGILLQA